MAEDRINAKQAWTQARVSIVTEMGHNEIVASESFRASVRAHCFFSARVAETRIVERLRKVSDDYTLGKLDKATARAQLKTFLRGEGYRPDGAVTDDEDTDHRISNLAGTARLNLILDQQKLMADAIGRRSEILRLGAPLQRYVGSWKRDKRDSHMRYYDIVLPATDPFWATHTPPLEFNCGCSIEAVWDETDAGEFGGVARAEQDKDGNWTVTAPDGSRIPVPPSESGYEFDSSAPFQLNDLGRLHEPYRERVVKDMERVVAEQRQPMHFIASGPEGGASAMDLPGLDGLDDALANGVADVRAQAVQAGLDPDAMPAPHLFTETNAIWKAAGLDVNNPPASLMDALPESGRTIGALGAEQLRRVGLPGAAMDIVLRRGSKKAPGLKHCWFHHKEVFCDAGETAAIVAATFGNAESLLSLSLVPAKGAKIATRIAAYDRASQSVCVLEIRDGRAELLSWHRAVERYSDKQLLLRSQKDAAGEETEE